MPTRIEFVLGHALNLARRLQRDQREDGKAARGAVARAHTHTEAHGTASGTMDLPVGEKPGMMLTVSVTVITCAKSMPALPGGLGGQTVATSSRRTARAPRTCRNRLPA